MKGLTYVIAGLLLMLPLNSGIAQDDILNKIINVPGSTKVSGAKGRMRKDEGVQGGKAMRIAVPGKTANVWDIAASSAIDKPVKAGDNLVLAFWARFEEAENGASTVTLPFSAVQLSSAPYTPLFNQQVTVGPTWALHQVRGKADKDYPAGALNAAIHLASGKQVIDLGPVFVLNMGQ
jgi:hypothetical protein